MKISGSVTLNLLAEERIFLIKAFKTIQTNTELEERIVKRTIMRLLRQNTHNYPLYPPVECPKCERMIAAKSLNVHRRSCKRREKYLSYKVDPEILRRIELEQY